MQRSNGKSSLETLESLETLRTLLFHHPFLFPVFCKKSAKVLLFLHICKYLQFFFLFFILVSH